VAGEQLQLRRGVLGRAVAHQLDLVELVQALDSARVLPRGAGLPAEARRVGDEPARQVGGVEHLVPVQVRDRHLGGRDEEQVVAAHRVRVVLELRELPRAGHRRPRDERRRPHLLVAVLGDVRVDEVVEERAHEPGAAPAVHGEPRAADLRGALEVEHAEPRADVPVRRRGAGGARLAPRAHHGVALLAAGGHVGERDVRQAEEDVVQPPLRGRQARVERGDLVAEGAAARDEVVGALAGALAARDLLRARVARRLAFLDLLDERAAVALEPVEPLEVGGVRLERAAAREGLAERLGALADDSQVEHRATRARGAATGSRSSG
jgi:hypothetical protein